MSTDPYAGFSKESKAIIRELEDLGWTFVIRNHGASGKAPDGKTTGSIPRKLSRANRSQQNSEAILSRWKRVVDAASTGSATEVLSQVADAITSSPAIDPVIDGVLARAADKHARAALAKASESEGPMEVSRRPWLARQGTSRKDATADLYESQAVVEVTWSDGTVTYSCSMEGCAYTSDNPRSVSSHFRAHVRKGEHTPVGNLARPAVAKDVPIDPATIGDGYKGKGSTYSPTERLVKALAHALEQAGTADLTALAYAALMWSHDRPDLPDPEAREPLTDAQVIQRIRSLVGGRDPETEEALRNALGTVAEQEETVRLQEQALEHLRREVAALSERLTEMTEHRDSLQADLDAWLALAPRYKES